MIEFLANKCRVIYELTFGKKLINSIKFKLFFIEKKFFARVITKKLFTLQSGPKILNQYQCWIIFFVNFSNHENIQGKKKNYSSLSKEYQSQTLP